MCIRYIMLSAVCTPRAFASDTDDKICIFMKPDEKFDYLWATLDARDLSNDNKYGT